MHKIQRLHREKTRGMPKMRKLLRMNDWKKERMQRRKKRKE